MIRPYIWISDQVFENANEIRAEALNHNFKDTTSPVDGVVYPRIAEASASLNSAIWLKLRHAFPWSVIDIKFCFLRLMMEGDRQPHRIHQDQTMGEFSAHVYLNSSFDRPMVGTQFWEHPAFGERFNEQNFSEKDWDKVYWKRRMFVPARFNRLLIHDSSLWHSAEPNEGFGRTLTDARLVLTTFFNLRER